VNVKNNTVDLGENYLWSVEQYKIIWTEESKITFHASHIVPFCVVHCRFLITLAK